MRRRVSAKLFLSIAVPVTLGIAVLALLQGYKEFSAGEILQALGAGMGLCEPLHADDQTIVLTIRLPRILLALFGGAALAIAGTVMQAVFRNPLASPEILGTSQGAALGATVAIGMGWSSTTLVALPAAAVLGALLVTGLVYYIAGGTRGLSVSSLLLAGIAMNTLIGALIAFAISYLSHDSWGQGSQILFWLMGSFDRTMGVDAVMVAVSLLLFSLALLPFLRDMDLLTLKDEGAAALGVNVVFVRSVLLVIACSLTAVTVAFTGGIAFVGLVVPHMARLVVGPAHRTLVPCAAVLGSFMLLLSDYVCRVLVPDSGLRVGVVMAMMGAPFFLLLLIRMRRGKLL